MLERFVSLQRRTSDPRTGAVTWRLLPGCERVRVWELSNTTSTDDDGHELERLTHFHVDFRENIERGTRVVFAGEAFEIRRVTDSNLRGLELTCSRMPPPASELAPRRLTASSRPLI